METRKKSFSVEKTKADPLTPPLSSAAVEACILTTDGVKNHSSKKTLCTHSAVSQENKPRTAQVGATSTVQK